MSSTPFDPEQKKISDKVHLNYRDILYSTLLKVEPEAIAYDVLPESFRDDADRHVGIDCFLDTTFPGLSYAMRSTVSFRFRSDIYQSYQDVTFTTYNYASDLPGELSKIIAQYFTYGYYDGEHRLIEAVILDVPYLKGYIAHGKIQPMCSNAPNYRSLQSFVGYSFESLKLHNLMLIHFKKVNEVLVPIWRRGQK